MNQFHFIVIGFDEDAKRGIKKALKKFSFTSAILSGVHMYKEKCITKEKFDEMYKLKDEIETRMDLPVGEYL